MLNGAGLYLLPPGVYVRIRALSLLARKQAAREQLPECHHLWLRYVCVCLSAGFRLCVCVRFRRRATVCRV